MRKRDQIALEQSKVRRGHQRDARERRDHDRRASRARDPHRTCAGDRSRVCGAAIVADPDPEIRETTGEPADRELRALIDGASIGSIFAATLEHRATDGQTAELQTHLGLAPNQIPVAMLRGRAPVEHRATGITPAPGKRRAKSKRNNSGCFPSKLRHLLGYRFSGGRCRRSGVPSADKRRRRWGTGGECNTRGDRGRVFRRSVVARSAPGQFLLFARRSRPDSKAWTAHFAQTFPTRSPTSLTSKSSVGPVVCLPARSLRTMLHRPLPPSPTT